MFELTKRALRGLLVVALFSCGAVAAEEKYPTRPITIIAAVGAGTGGDLAVRTLAEKLGPALGQPIVIMNVPGAGGVVGAARGAAAAPDGYVLSAIPSWIMTIRPHLTPKVSYDPFKDFVGISHIASFPTVLYVNPSIKANTVQEFISLVKKHPKQFTYASPGVGSAQHLAMEQLKVLAGIDLLHVPFQGSTQAAIESVAGRVDSGFNGISTLEPFIKRGELRPLAWAEDRRDPILPNLPTMHEAGVKDFTYEVSIQLFGPAGLPKSIVNRLNAEIRKITADPELRERWAAAGMQPRSASPEEFESLVKAEWNRNGDTMQKIGLKAD